MATNDNSLERSNTAGTSRRKLLRAAAWAPPLAVAAGSTQLAQGFAKAAKAQSRSRMTDLGAREAVVCGAVRQSHLSSPILAAWAAGNP